MRELKAVTKAWRWGEALEVDNNNIKLLIRNYRNNQNAQKD